MNLTEILKPSCVKVPLDATDKKAAIFELVDILEHAGFAGDADSLKHAVWTREQTRTTGIGHGLAIPHGKCECMRGLAMAIGKPADPMEFAAIDQRPVRLIVLLASPPDRTSDHIQALAKISRLMTDADFREKLFAADSSDDLYAMLAAQEQHVAS
ncbi:MAG: PTS sugar transporter subunit IIA [Phycisphaerales bacterium]